MRIPGFCFDPRRHRGRFEVILPGTGARKRRRKTVRVETRDQALALWKAWRAKVLEGRALKGTTLDAYHEETWPKVMKRVAERTAQHDSWVLEKVLLPRLGRYELGRINDAVRFDQRNCLGLAEGSARRGGQGVARRGAGSKVPS